MNGATGQIDGFVLESFQGPFGFIAPENDTTDRLRIALSKETAECCTVAGRNNMSGPLGVPPNGFVYLGTTSLETLLTQGTLHDENVDIPGLGDDLLESEFRR